MSELLKEMEIKIVGQLPHDYVSIWSLLGEYPYRPYTYYILTK